MRAMGTEVTRGRESRIELARRIRTTFLSEEFLLCRATLASMKTETTAPKKMGGDRPRNLKSVGNPRCPKRLRISLAPGMLDFSKLSRVFTQFKSPSGCPRMGQPVPVHAQRVDIVFAVIS